VVGPDARLAGIRANHNSKIAEKAIPMMVIYV
jgi:hypothetical protein